jgi:hypothetical protein
VVVCSFRRHHTVPAGLDCDLWLGPAPSAHSIILCAVLLARMDRLRLRRTWRQHLLCMALELGAGRAFQRFCAEDGATYLAFSSSDVPPD